MVPTPPATVSDPKMNMIHLEFFLGIALSWAVRVYAPDGTHGHGSTLKEKSWLGN